MAKTARENRQQTRATGKHTNMEPWFSVFKRSLQDALAIDRSQITALPAIRSAIAFILPLAIGVATGHVVEGVSIAGGAASVGAVGMTYTYRARARTLFLACLGIAISAFVGSVTSGISWLAVLVAGLWGFGAGLLVSVSPIATVVGIQSVVALIILTHFELDPLHAFLQAALMLAGALLQVLLAIIPLPWQDTAPERSALANVYQKLADYAANDSKEETAWQAGNALLKASSVLSDSNQQNAESRIFARLLEDAEQIRLSLIVLRRARRQLEGSSNAHEELSLQMERVRQATITELRAIVYELRSHRGLKHSQPYQNLRHAIAELRRRGAAYADDETVRRLLTYCEALLAQTSSASVLLQARTQRHIHLSMRMHTPGWGQMHEAIGTLRANLTLRSTTFRHAIRMGIALALATALYRLIPLPIQRGYWIPLTVLLVLRADFSSTFTRGIARFLGTILGAVLTTLLIATLAPTKEWLVVLDTLVAFLAFSLLFANYALFSAFTTIEVIFLLAFVIPQPIETVAYRAIDTTIGGLLAWLVYILWPTWERTQIPENIAHRLEALHNYFDAILTTYIDPTTYDDELIQNRRQESRLARTNLDASIDRLRKEPRKANGELIQGLLEAINGIARSVLSLDAHLQDAPSRQAHPEISAFVGNVDEVLNLLTTSIRQGQEPPPLPDLEGPLRAIEQYGKADHDVDENSSHGIIVAEARRIVRSINALNNLLATKHGDTPMYEPGQAADRIPALIAPNASAPPQGR